MAYRQFIGIFIMLVQVACSEADFVGSGELARDKKGNHSHGDANAEASEAGTKDNELNVDPGSQVIQDPFSAGFDQSDAELGRESDGNYACWH